MLKYQYLLSCDFFWDYNTTEIMLCEIDVFLVSKRSYRLTLIYYFDWSMAI